MCTKDLCVHEESIKLVAKTENVSYNMDGHIRLREGGINYETQESTCCDTCSNNGIVICYDSICT